MDIRDWIKTGMSNEVSFQVEPEHTAVHVGSGSLKVLATPILIAFMERAARDLLAIHLQEGFSSVGVHVDVRHLAPTPQGGAVRVECQVLAVDGRRVDFRVQAWDAQEKIGEGAHSRVIIDEGRFLSRVAAKQSGDA